MTWTPTNRPTGEILVHSEKPVWIVHYQATQVKGEHWQAYKAVLPVPIGRIPWSVDNRRVGSDMGFQTLEAAMEAGEAV